MPSSIIIKGIQLNARCGVSETEQSQPQPILVDIILRTQNDESFRSDRLTDTIDYAAVRQSVRDIGERQSFALLEALSEHICQRLFQEFPITLIKIWVRKIQPPIKDFTGSVGIRLLRSRQEVIPSSHEPASPFLTAIASRLPQGRALDVASGRGRHALFLANQGYSVHGIDRNRDNLDYLNAKAQETKQINITTEHIDLEIDDRHPPDLGTETYDVILVFFYLHRPLFPQLIKALKPGGVIVYETFLLENHLQRQHPRRKEFCLKPNELLTLLPEFLLFHYDEGDHIGTTKTNRAFTAQALARKP